MDRHEAALALLHEGTVIPAIPLALDAERNYSPYGQRLLTRYYLESGAGGIAVAVHSTQFAIRNPEHALLEPVLRTVAAEIDRYERETGRVVVRIAGACGPAEQAATEAALARDLGYDAVLLSPGGLDGLFEAELLARTARVAQVMPVIGFYLQSAVGGRRLSFDYWRQVCDCPGVVAIKCAPFDRYRTLDVLRAAAASARRDEIALYTGNDDHIVLDLLTKYRFDVGGTPVAVRFVGGLLGHWSVWTHTVVEQFVAIQKAATQGQVPDALLTLAEEITDANAVIFDAANGFAGCIPGIHEILRRQGLMQGIWCLDPQETLSPGQAEEIDRVLRMYPHLTDNAFVAGNVARWQQLIREEVGE